MLAWTGSTTDCFDAHQILSYTFPSICRTSSRLRTKNKTQYPAQSRSLISLCGLQHSLQQGWLWVLLAMWLCLSILHNKQCSVLAQRQNKHLHSESRRMGATQQSWFQSNLAIFRVVIWRSAILRVRKVLWLEVVGVPLSFVFCGPYLLPLKCSSLSIIFRGPIWIGQ